MIEVATAINGFPVPQSDQPAVILVPVQVLKDLLSEVQAPCTEVRDLKARQDALESQISSREAQPPGQTEILILKTILETHQERLRDLGVRMVGLEMAQDELETRFFAKVSAPSTPPRGEKTLTRIAKIEEVLREKGSCTLGELRKIMKIDGATMTRLLSKLDKRRFEVFARSGDRREKVLRLKAQIR